MEVGNLNIGNRIFTKVNRAPKELVELFRGVPSANINDEMNRLFCMHDYIHLQNPGKAVQLLGTAITVKCPAGDNLMMHEALDLARPGDVIIVDSDSGCNRSIAGEIMMRLAQGKGVAGWVIDGRIRDIEGAEELTMPIYASGVTPQGPYKHGPGEVNVPVSCGGQVVFPGDIIVGDRDGVVVIRPQDAEAVAKVARAHLEKETRTFEKIRNAFHAYEESHVNTTQKRLGGKNVGLYEESYANHYGIK